jgi:hypothetical protein
MVAWFTAWRGRGVQGGRDGGGGERSTGMVVMYVCKHLALLCEMHARM